jgi:transposase
MNVTTIGIDLAKDVLQIHGVNEHGKAVVRKQLKRAQHRARSGFVQARAIIGFRKILAHG